MMRRLTVVFVLSWMIWAPCATQGLAAPKSEGARSGTSNSQRKKVQKQIEQKLRELDREIDELKAKAPKHGDQLKRQYQRQMADLQRKREIAGKQFKKLKASTERAWQDMEPGVDAAVKDLDAACQRAVAEFKNSK